MKKFTKLLFIVVLSVISFIGFSQTDNHHEHKNANGGDIDKFYIRYDYDADSLVGFDEAAALEYAKKYFTEEWQQQREIAGLKRNYIDFKYGYKTAAPVDPTVQAPCTNPGFETGTLAGWTAVEGPNTNSSTMAGCCPNATTFANIVTAGADPNVAALQRVPPGGGTYSCRMGNTTTGGKSYRLNQTFTVTPANSVFIYKYAVVLEDGSHSCSEQPFFNIKFETCNNVVIPCAQYNVTAAGSLCTSGGDPNFITSGAYKYLPWQTRSFDLSAYIGQCVNIEFTVGGCVQSQGAHAGYCYIDAACDPMTLELNGVDIPVGQANTNFCSLGANTLCAPPGFTSYAWTGPGGATGQTTRCITASAVGSYSVTLGMQGSSCQSPMLFSNFVLVPSPIANFNFTTTACQSTFTVPFADASSLNGGPAITSWTWDFNNDGVPDNTPSNPNPTNTFPGQATYNVELKVSNGGCSDSITKVVTISPAVIASFNNTSGCLNGVTNFTATPTPTTNIASHVWDYGDNTANGNGLNTTHTYTSSGIKTVTYTVTTTSGCQSVFTKTLNIFPNPVVAIAANTVCLGLPTTFVNTSSAAPDNITGWSWDFTNDGTPDIGTQTPTNTYPTAGTFVAALTATTNNGCVNTNTVAVKVNALPTATFTPIGACLNANVVLNNTSGAPLPSDITSYGWNFGAGASPATGNTANPTPLVYSTSGVKTIVLNITANTTCTASITKTVNIVPLPVANFSATSVCQGSVTAFTDLSTPTGSITGWSWDFTNNNSPDNTTNAPTNTYPTSGTYSVSLMVSVGSCTNSVVIPIDVWGHAIPNFIPNSVCFGASSSFSNTTNVTTNPNVGGTPGWDWAFGDGISSTAQDPTHIYSSTLTPSYNVTLTATTTHGCVDNVVKTVVVNALPTATFTPVNACINGNVALNNTSSIALPDNITNFAWTFNTGSSPATSIAQNPPTLSYNSSGIKSITLIITANTTCSATITQTVEIYAQPVANFSATAVCQGVATAFTDLSTSGGSITGWAWSYTNNGTTNSTVNAPTNIFATSGTYTTSLIVTDSRSCKDTIKLPIDVWGHTIPNFTPDKVCFGTSSVFTNLTDDTSNPNVGVGTTYNWDFADATTSTVFSPSHTYNLGGNVNATYNVTLTATSLHNCIDNIIKVVNVYAIPTASFTSNEVCLGSATALTNASNGNGNNVNTFDWDFSNDGTVDATGIPNPNFTFPNFGSNPVSYTVSTSPAPGLVCSNSTNTITVWVNPNPIPDFTFVNNCINAQPNTFNGSSSTIAIGTNTMYVWSFGNGVSVPSAASTSSVNYGAPGVYNVTLTVTSDKGCVKNVVKQVEVFAKPNMNISNSPACDQQAMTFTAVTMPNSGTMSNWYWDLNNSITSIEATGQSTSFTFVGPGAQTIGVIGETSRGCRDTVIKSIYVNYVPVPQFSVDVASGCPKLCVNFSDLTPSITGPSQIAQWQWTFGDGSNPVTNSSNSSVNHCYINNSSSQLATFDVGLVVTTDSGCVGPITKMSYITVYPVPVADYTVSPNPGSITEPLVYFTNESQDYTKWWWTFVGTGPYKVDSTNVNPTHFYDDVTAQIYFSNLIVQNQYGCADTAYVPIEIRPEFTFYIPNAFSPSNDDGINDYFTGIGIGIDKYEMWIFDRWGVMIYYTDDIKKGWDGRVQGKSAEGKQDVYTWKVKLRDVLGKNHQYIGHVTLLK